VNQNPYSVGEHLDLPNRDDDGKAFNGSVRGMQVVATAMMTGVFILIGVASVKNNGGPLGLQTPDFLTVLAAVFGLICVVNQFIIPPIVVRVQLKQIEGKGFVEHDATVKSDRILAVFRTQLIIGLALLEGASVSNVIALMVEFHVISYAVALVLLGFMALKFPTRDKVSFWVQDKLRELQM
jgi:hypothetical protein